MIRLVRDGPEQITVEEVGLNDLTPPREGDPWLWVDVIDASTEEIEAIGRMFGFDEIAVSEVMGSTVFPKVSEMTDHLFLITHSPGVREGRITTYQLDAFIAPGALVTFHREPVAGVDLAIQQLQRARRGASSPGLALASVLETGADRSLQLVDALDDQIAELEVLAVAGKSEVVARIQDLRRDAIILRRALAPQRDMIRELTRAEHHLDHETRRRLDSIYHQTFRIVESLDGARALLGAVLETYRSSIAERTNEVMKVLTVFAVVLLPLSLIAGIYGMNFANMPALDTTWGFYAVLGVMALTGVALWWYFARRGFVVGPRVPRVDRAVSRGLAGVIDLTVQPVLAVTRRRGASDS